MKPAELQQALKKNQIPGLLCLFGEERFNLERMAARVVDHVVPADARDFNLQIFHGKEVAGESVLDAIRTLPVFAPRRLVYIKDIHESKAAELEIFLSALGDLGNETVFLCTGDKIDLRKKFFQELKKKGCLVEFPKYYPNQIPAFVKEQAREAGRSFTEDALALFCRRVGTNLVEIQGELEKLFSYLGERDLADAEDVAAVVSDVRVDSIFELTDALGRRQQGEALRLLHRLLDEGMAPLLILNMVVRHFRQLWKIRELLDEGSQRRDLPRKAGINPYLVDNLVSQARLFAPTQIRKTFDRFLETDLALKSSGGHPAALLEELLLSIVKGENKRAAP